MMMDKEDKEYQRRKLPSQIFGYKWEYGLESVYSSLNSTKGKYGQKNHLFDFLHVKLS